jgi:hypothetical protein
MSGRETAFGLEPFEPYDHEADAEDLQRDRDAADDAGIVQFFPCPRCDGHGCHMNRSRTQAMVCEDCTGQGQLGATEEDVENAATIGSSNPFCRHDWTVNEESDRSYCSSCGADGDA